MSKEAKKKTLHYIVNIRVPTEMAHGVQIFNMCAALNKIFEVSLIVPKRKNTIVGEAFEYYGLIDKFRVVFIPTFFLVPISSRFRYYTQRILFSFTSLIHSLNTRPELIYTRDELVAFTHSFFFEQVYLEIHTRKRSFLYKLILKRVKGIIVISQGLKEHVGTLHQKKFNVLVLHDGVPYQKIANLSKQEERLKLGLNIDTKIVGYIGKYKTMGQEKGVDTLIEAFSKLPSDGTLLLIVGADSQDLPDLHKALSKSNISNYKLIEHVGHDQALSYIASSDILVMNYPNQQHYRNDMSPLKLFEYLASGNLIIASDLPSIREIVHENQVLFVEAGNVTELAKTLRYAVDNLTKLEYLGQESKQLAVKYDWGQRVKRFIDFYTLHV